MDKINEGSVYSFTEELLPPTSSTPAETFIYAVRSHGDGFDEDGYSHLRNGRQSDFYQNSSVVSEFSLEIIIFIQDACIQMHILYAYKNALNLSKVTVKTFTL